MTPSRRDFLATASAAATATTVVGSLCANPVVPQSNSTKRCLFLHLVGGPSQLDTFDPKPHASSDIRGPFGTIPTAIPGVHFSELLPRTASLMKDVSLIRTLHHDEAPIHENGFQLLHTGRRFGDGPAWPGMGAVVNHLRKSDASNPYMNLLYPGVPINCGISVDLGQGAAWLGERKPYSPDYSDRPPSFLENSLMACHHLMEGGSQFAVVNMYDSVFNSTTWDCHAAGGRLNSTLDDYRESVCPQFDIAFSATIRMLKQSGQLDETLVVAVGEFGRTPKLNANGGRDHWAGCWSALIAGGGVQGGRVIGESDAHAAMPKDRPVTCPELVATIYHALGIPSSTTIRTPDGKAVRVVDAEPVRELF
ncbi:MAG: DUF1501 domain-containing protein [Gemmataceae bacterium]